MSDFDQRVMDERPVKGATSIISAQIAEMIADASQKPSAIGHWLWFAAAMTGYQTGLRESNRREAEVKELRTSAHNLVLIVDRLTNIGARHPDARCPVYRDNKTGYTSVVKMQDVVGRLEARLKPPPAPRRSFGSWDTWTAAWLRDYENAPRREPEPPPDTNPKTW